MAEAPRRDDPASLLRLAECDTCDASPAGDDSPYDALADLFLDNNDPAPQSTPLKLARDDEPAVRAAPPPAEAAAASTRTDAAAPVRFELVVANTLPAPRLAWLAQHAQCSSAPQAAALLVLTPARTTLRLLPSGRPGDLEPPASHILSLQDALRCAASTQPAWFVATDLDEALSLLEEHCPASVTLLSGADEDAVASAHEALRSLHDAGCRCVGLRLVGAARERLETVSGALRQAAATMLELSVDALEPLQRLESTDSVALYDDDAPLQPAAAVQALRSAAASAQRRKTDVSATFPASVHEPAGTLLAGQEQREMRIDSLSSLLHPPLAMLPVRCPREQAVELALDASSSLHLLVRRSPRAFEAAAVVRAWAAEHADLLELAVRKPVRRASEAPLHIFVESAEEARRLLSAPCRIHLLVQRHIAGQDHLFAIDL